MGTGRPHVEITAATLAGGRKNQDRFAYGDGWAFVLDGASSFTKAQSEHDGGWYAERLKQALSAGLTDSAEHTTPGIVEDAIRAVGDAHGGDAASCPTSTIGLARWNDETLEVYVLGDSTVALISDNSEELLSDTRMENIADPVRKEYRARLSAGHGFDERHRELLQHLQTEQAAARNNAGGYWIAGAQPAAAHHGLCRMRPLETIRGVVLATDGAATALKYGTLPNWKAFTETDIQAVIEDARRAEESDPQAARWPRSKPHDDKTAVAITFPTTHPERSA